MNLARFLESQEIDPWFPIVPKWLDGWFYDGFCGREQHRVRPDRRGEPRATCGHERKHHWQYDETREPSMSCEKCLDLDEKRDMADLQRRIDAAYARDGL